MGVQVIANKKEFDTFVASGNVAIDFYADWCGPCRGISPKFEEFSSEYTNVKFGKVNVDEAEDVSEACGISAMPTFFFYKDGTKVGDFKGANIETLRTMLDKYFK